MSAAESVPVQRVLRVVRGPLLALVGGWGCCGLALVEARRPGILMAALGGAAVLAALATGWRIVGTVAVLLAGSAPLMAGAVDERATGTGRLLAATVLVLALVVGLDGAERRDRTTASATSVVVAKASPLRRWGPVVPALAGTTAVSLIGHAPAVPSVALVLLGLLAGVGAVVAVTRLH